MNIHVDIPVMVYVIMCYDDVPDLVVHVVFLEEVIDLIGRPKFIAFAKRPSQVDDCNVAIWTL